MSSATLTSDLLTADAQIPSYVRTHLIHGLAVAVPMVVIASAIGYEKFTITRKRRRPAGNGEVPHLRTDASLKAIAVLWIAAGAIHLAITKEHFAENTLLGAFFLILAAAQFGYAAIILVSPSRLLIAAGLVTNLLVILLWTYTRVVAIPFGLGGREQVGAADIAASVFEAAVCLLSASTLIWDDALHRVAITRKLVLLATTVAVMTGALAAATAS